MFIREPKVILLNHTPEPEKMITAAAKLCYSNTKPSELYDNLSEEQIEKFLNMIMKLGHGSILEHVVFNFAIEDISRVVETQLVRHRMASPSIQSGRYVKRNPQYVLPKEIEKDSECMKIYEDACNHSTEAYVELTNRLTDIHLAENLGVTVQELYEIKIKSQDEVFLKKYNRAKSNAEKRAIEDARYVLPQSLRTYAVYSIDLRNLINLIGKRKCRRAQREIQLVAQQMYDLIEPLLPTISKYIGAPCEIDRCHEGVMTCGDAFPKKNKQ